MGRSERAVSLPILINSLRLQARQRDYEWFFHPGVNLLIGPVGVGKTSLLELIKFAFGGDAILTPTITGAGHRVELDVQVGDSRYVLSRPIGRGNGRVDVLREDELLGTFAVEAGPEERGISDFLLEALDIPRLTLPRSRARPKDELTRVTFRDLYVFLYLDQQEIDRSTAHDIDPVRNPKRLMTFELIYRLVDSRLADLRVQHVQAEASLRRLQELAANTRAFLRRMRQRTKEDLQTERMVVAGALLEIERELAQLRDRARAATATAVDARGELAQIEVAVARADEQLAGLRAERDALLGVRAQIEIDQQRIVKALVAGQVFAAFEFDECPRCTQSIRHLVRGDGECRLCGQEEPRVLDSIALDAERERLDAQAGETQALIERNEAEIRAAQAQIEHLRTEQQKASTRLDEQSEDAVSPFVDRMSQLSARHGELRGRDETLKASLASLDELGAIEREVAQERARIATLAQQIREEEADLEIARSRIAEVGRLFDETLRGFDMPWYESATIDPETFRPIVNGVTMQELSSGGMKTMVNVAYYLANLSYAIANVDSRLPRFMVIDSPRKNFGYGTADREHAGRIYERIVSMQQVARIDMAAFSRQFQLIIADNDVPERFARLLGRRRIHRFTYEAPLLDDLEHPGPDVKTIGDD